MASAIVGWRARDDAPSGEDLPPFGSAGAAIVLREHDLLVALRGDAGSDSCRSSAW
jgi:hypothetical protein